MLFLHQINSIMSKTLHRKFSKVSDITYTHQDFLYELSKRFLRADISKSKQIQYDKNLGCNFMFDTMMNKKNFNGVNAKKEIYLDFCI